MSNTKDDAIKILIQNGYKYELEDATIYVYVNEYNQEKIDEIKRLIPQNWSSYKARSSSGARSTFRFTFYSGDV